MTAKITLADLERMRDTQHSALKPRVKGIHVGYFYVPTKVFGIYTTYLFKGEVDAPDASIVGRVEMSFDDFYSAIPAIYAGETLTGGERIALGDSETIHDMLLKIIQ